MLYVNIPTREEVLDLAEIRADACLSIYLRTSPLPREREASRIELDNMVRDSFISLQESGFDKRRLATLMDRVAEVIEADDFWYFHAHSLAILATPEHIYIYRLANKVDTRLEVNDHFFLKPLFRALTFPHHAYVMALSENNVRLVEFFADAPPEEIKLKDMPKDARSAVGKSSLMSSLGHLAHESGTRGNKLRLSQYSRKVDEALRPLLLQSKVPLILVCTEPLVSLFRAVVSVPTLIDETVFISPDHLSVSELVDLARPVLDNHYAAELDTVKKLFEERAGQNRVVTDLADTAKAATYGMVGLLLVDFNKAVTGTIDEGGVLTFSDKPGSYGVIDEIVKRSMACGAKILAVREDDMVGTTGVAAILRYPL